MRNVMFVFLLLFLPSALMAKPTIALFLDDNESELGIGSREVVALSTYETYWWFGKLNLFRAICQHPVLPHSAVCGELNVGARWIIPLDVGNFCSIGNTLDLTPRRYPSNVIVVGLESKHQLDAGLLGTDTIASAGRSIPLSLAQSNFIAR